MPPAAPPDDPGAAPPPGPGDGLGDVIELRRRWAFLVALPLPLFALAAGLGLFAFAPQVNPLAGWLLILVLPAWLGWHLLRPVLDPRPDLVLAPQGLALRRPGWGTLALPWSAIRDVVSRDVPVTTRINGVPQTVWLRDTTLVTVAPAVLKAQEAEGAFVPTGPFVAQDIVPIGELVGVALHHGHFGLSAPALRHEVERRWRAFRDAPSPGVPGGGRTLRIDGGFAPSEPGVFMALMAAALAALAVTAAALVLG